MKVDGVGGGRKEVGVFLSFYIQVDSSSRRQIIEAVMPKENRVKGNFSVWGIAWGLTFYEQKTRG